MSNAYLGFREWASRGSLERESQPAAYRTRRLDEVNGVSVACDYRDIALCQQVLHIDDGFQFAGERPRQGLADEEAEVRISLARGSIEHIDWSHSRTAAPAIRSLPASAGARSAAFKFPCD